jgi:PAS domain S-box-containing protein
MNAKADSEKLNALEAENAALKEIIALMPGHVYWKDKQGRNLGCNINQAKMLGLLSCDAIIGKTVADFSSPEVAVTIAKIDQYVIANNEEKTFEETGTDINGHPAIYLTKKIPLHNKNGEVSGLLGISFDITDRKKLEESLLEAKEKAEHALKAKEIAETENQEKTKMLEDVLKDLNAERYYLKGKYKDKYLTKREAECIICWANGLTAKETGKKLKISPKTVELYISNIKNEFNCNSRAELIAFAIEACFLDGAKPISQAGKFSSDH